MTSKEPKPRYFVADIKAVSGEASRVLFKALKQSQVEAYIANEYSTIKPATQDELIDCTKSGIEAISLLDKPADPPAAA